MKSKKTKLAALRSWLVESISDQFAFFAWAAAVLLVAAAYLTYNALYTHYKGLGFGVPAMASYLPWGVGLIAITAYLKKISERYSLVMEVITKLYWVYFISALGCMAIQFSPFPLIDSHLLAADNALGFSSTGFFEFVRHHHWLHQLFTTAYHSLDYLLILMPFVFAFFIEKRSVRIFYLANIIATFFTYNIYYYFPTTEPAHVAMGSNFLQAQYDIIAQWYQIHGHLKNTIHIGDLIAFPSFHVIWSCLLIYLTKNRKWIFYPMLVWGAVIMTSTVALGWHFLTDVMGGLAIAGIAIYLAELGEKTGKSLKGRLPSIATSKFGQRFNRQALNDDREYDNAVGHR
ncbi:MAG: phosphatase PAP2 family protein [Coxiellaceae bacterium]|nr:phosphatase PAP2 family protein [Coxiellaceae bacterium]